MSQDFKRFKVLSNCRVLPTVYVGHHSDVRKTKQSCQSLALKVEFGVESPNVMESGQRAGFEFSLRFL